MIIRGAYVLVLLWFFATTILFVVLGDWIGVAAQVTYLGGWALFPMMRRNAYRAGYVTGRREAMHGVLEAMQRRLSPRDWLSAELERQREAS